MESELVVLNNMRWTLKSILATLAFGVVGIPCVIVMALYPRDLMGVYGFLLFVASLIWIIYIIYAAVHVSDIIGEAEKEKKATEAEKAKEAENEAE